MTTKIQTRYHVVSVYIDTLTGEYFLKNADGVTMVRTTSFDVFRSEMARCILAARQSVAQN